MHKVRGCCITHTPHALPCLVLQDGEGEGEEAEEDGKTQRKKDTEKDKELIIDMHPPGKPIIAVTHDVK